MLELRRGPSVRAGLALSTPLGMTANTERRTVNAQSRENPAKGKERRAERPGREQRKER